MIEGLRQLGLAVEHDRGARTIRVTGCDGRPPAASADLMLGNSGTTVRFLTAMATLGHGVYRLDGTPRMRERPIQDLLDALRQLGADAVSEAGNGCPPVVVRAAGLPGGRAEIAGNISSQFLSAVLLAAPARKRRRAGRPRRTGLAALRRDDAGGDAGIRRRRSAKTDRPEPARSACPAPQSYRGRTYAIEPDASAASYFFAAAAIAGGSVTVEGLSRESLQGDVAFCDCLRQMGCDVD